MTPERSSACLERELLQLELPGGPKLHVLLLCVVWPGDEGYYLLESEGLVATAVNPRVVASPRHAGLAAALAYYMRARGRGIARKAGIDVALILTGERNISKALSIASPLKEGKALVIAASEEKVALENLEKQLSALPRARCCLDPLEALRSVGGGAKCVSRSPAECAEAIMVTRSSVLAAFRK